MPGLRKNLFSIGATIRRGITSCVNAGHMEFKRDGRRIELEAALSDNNMFIMAIRKLVTIEANIVNDLKTWHDRLGHISLQRMHEMMVANV